MRNEDVGDKKMYRKSKFKAPVDCIGLVQAAVWGEAEEIARAPVSCQKFPRGFNFTSRQDLLAGTATGELLLRQTCSD